MADSYALRVRRGTSADDHPIFEKQPPCRRRKPLKPRGNHARGAHMDRRFPECKQLHEAYRKCFAQQPFRWGQATGSTEDKCEEAYEAFRECVETSLEKQKEKK